MTAEDWYRMNNAQHAECPWKCQKPQPFIARQDDQPDGPWTLYCGRCWFKAGVLSAMVPCDPVTCEDV